METMHFSDYGILEWLDIEQYFAEPWRYIGYAEGADGKDYDLVMNPYMEVRYTKI